LSFCPVYFGNCVAWTEGQATQWPKEKRQKDRQPNDQKKGAEGQATKWPKEQGQKDKQQNGQRKGTEGQATQ
jgi:hypothetical protein